MSASGPTVVFAGDRDVAVGVLEFLVAEDADIAALLLPDENAASHDEQLLELCDHLDDERILRGKRFREDAGKRLLADIGPEYIVSVHFQYIYPGDVLDIPTEGVVNLHPAYLPFNRGWHTPSWAIWEQSPYGATLHFMEEEIDSGDVIARRQVAIRPDDTAHTLYNRAKEAEVDLFEETWPELANFSYDARPQNEDVATAHEKSDLKEIQELELDETAGVGSVIRRLRALTTNDVTEAAYFEQDGERYRVRIDIIPEKEVE